MRPPPDPQRWVDSTDGSPLVLRAAELVRNVGPSPGLAPSRVEAIRTRIQPALAGGGAFPSGVVTTSAAVAVIGGIVAAGLWVRPTVGGGAPKTAEPAPAVAPAPLVVPAPLRSAPVVPPASSPTPAPVRRRRTIRTPITHEVPEAELLKRAAIQLRIQQSPESALATLDEHRSRFPSGALGFEAEVLRLEALLALERSSEAATLLDTLDEEKLAVHPNADELRVLRFELLGHEGRWREALAGFEAVLEGAASPEIHERALYGRASALSRLGELQAAREGLEGYLERYPDGRFSAAARRALSR